MLHASDCFHMISSADNALVAGAFEVTPSADEPRPPKPPLGPDPGETVRLPIVDRPIAGALLVGAG